MWIWSDDLCKARGYLGYWYNMQWILHEPASLFQMRASHNFPFSPVTGMVGTGTGCHKVNPCPHCTRTVGLWVFTGCHVPGWDDPRQSTKDPTTHWALRGNRIRVLGQRPKMSSNGEPLGAGLHCIYITIHEGCVRLSTRLCYCAMLC